MRNKSVVPESSDIRTIHSAANDFTVLSETTNGNMWFLGIQKVIFEEDVEDKRI